MPSLYKRRESRNFGVLETRQQAGGDDTACGVGYIKDIGVPRNLACNIPLLGRLLGVYCADLRSED